MADKKQNGASDDPGKEGLKAAIEVTKYTLAVAGGAIAFLLGSDSLKTATSVFAKTTMTLALAGFAISAIGGLLVLLQGASNLSNATYDLNQPLIKYPGMANIIGLMAGFIFATTFVIAEIWTAHAGH